MCSSRSSTRAERFRLTGSLKGYLATCVANRARNVNKAAWRRHGTALEGVPEPVCEAPPPEQAAIFGEEFGRLTEALQQLPYEQREVLLLRSHSGLRFAAIAKAQGVSHQHRARAGTGTPWTSCGQCSIPRQIYE